MQGVLVAAVDAAIKSMDGTVNKVGQMSVLVDLHGASHRSLDRVLLQEIFKVCLPVQQPLTPVWSDSFVYSNPVLVGQVMP